jgi:hypothetical protein
VTFVIFWKTFEIHGFFQQKKCHCNQIKSLKNKTLMQTFKTQLGNCETTLDMSLTFYFTCLTFASFFNVKNFFVTLSDGFSKKALCKR